MGDGGQLARGSLEYHDDGATISIGALGEAQQVRRFEDQQSSESCSQDATGEGWGFSSAEVGDASFSTQPLSPDQVLEVARARVIKLQRILETLGEEGDMYLAIQEALSKAESQARERPVSERIQSTELYVGRKQKRVEQARQQR